jgi:Na+-transporting NADH:ubiquinone oxidoreductase subunit NqrB
MMTRYIGLLVVALAILAIQLENIGIWILGAMCLAVVILPPKWNPAFWHKVHPGTGEIRKD